MASPEESKNAPFRRIRPSFEITLASQANYEKTVEGLGKICVEFQRLESYLKIAIPILLAPDDLGLGGIVTAQLSFNATLDLFYALYHYRFPDPAELKELKEFLGKCASAEIKRNKMIHSRWEFDSESGKGAIRTKHTAKNRKEFKRQREILSSADMEEIAGELRALWDEFFRDWVPRVHRWEINARTR
jgi:hypothetical protein